MALNAAQKYFLKTIVVEQSLDSIKAYPFPEADSVSVNRETLAHIWNENAPAPEPMVDNDNGQPSAEPAIDDKTALKAFQMILEEGLTEEQVEAALGQWDVDIEVNTLRQILAHPAPQNRASYHCDFEGHELENLPDAQPGLLGLTAHNDAKTPHVTKQDVVDFITEEVSNRIVALGGKVPLVTMEVPPIPERFQENVTGDQWASLPKYKLTEYLTTGGLYSHWMVDRLIEKHKVPFADIWAVYDQSPEKWNAVADRDVCRLIKHNVSFADVCTIYDQSPKKLKAVIAGNVRNLMSKYNVSFADVCTIYDQSPEKLQAIASGNISNLVENHNVPFANLCAIYDESIEKFNYLQSKTIADFMEKYNVPFTDLCAIYDASTEKFRNVVLCINAQNLMEDHNVSFTDICIAYDQSPENFHDIVQHMAHYEAIGIFMTELNIPFIDLYTIYNQPIEKFAALTDLRTYCLMKDSNVSFAEVCALYDESPEKLKVTACTHILKAKGIPDEQITAIYDQSVDKLDVVASSTALLGEYVDSFEIICALYDESPEKLKAVTTGDVVAELIEARHVPFADICTLYDKSPETLQEFVSEEVRNLPPEQFQARLQAALQQEPQQPQQVNVGGFNVPAPGNRIGPSSGQGMGKG